VAGVSIPYLSQIERGLRKPSADILQAIAKGLRISAETLYVQAGILEDRPVADVAAAIMGDPAINERQKQALVQIYRAFREEAGRSPSRATGEPPAKRSNPSARSGRKAPGAKAPAARAGRTRGGRAEPGAARTPHPTPLRSPTALTRREV
jgi:transcriptional regulator with XRE-family HTH domain